MRGFPPKREAQVTLANWREAPLNRWSLHNVRQILPTQPIERGGTASALPREVQAIDRIGLRRADGRTTTVGGVLGETFTDGFVVLHRGRIVHETYGAGMRPEDQHILFSVTKSVTATLAGIYVEKGLLDPDARVVRYIPEAKGSAYGTATVRHVLDMTVGIAFVEDYTSTTGDFVRYREASGWNPVFDPRKLSDIRTFVTTLKPAGKHGHAFHYVSPNSDLLGWIIERATDTRFHELASRDLWGPMGAEFDAYMATDRVGTPRTAGGLCTSLRDLARFGQMMLERGQAQGRQVVPGAWIDDIRTNGDPKAWARGSKGFLPGGRYRGKWYITGNEHDAFCGIGIHGQWLYVDPAASVVIAKFSSQPAAVDDAMDDLCLRAFDAVARSL